MKFCEKFCSRTPGAGQQLLFLLTSFAVICFFVVKFYLRSAHDSWGVPDQLFFDNQTLHWSRCAPKSRGAPDQMQSFNLTRDKVHCRGAAPDSGFRVPDKFCSLFFGQDRTRDKVQGAHLTQGQHLIFLLISGPPTAWCTPGHLVN